MGNCDVRGLKTLISDAEASTVTHAANFRLANVQVIDTADENFMQFDLSKS
jgi:hypothetical protein